MNQSQHFGIAFSKQADHVRSIYRKRLTKSIDCIWFLLRQGLASCGHDKSKNSANQGICLKLIQFLTNHNEDIKSIVLQNVPKNNQLVSLRSKNILSVLLQFRLLIAL